MSDLDVECRRDIEERRCIGPLDSVLWRLHTLMWSPATRNTTLALACATLATIAAFQGVSRLVQWRLAQQYRRHAASRPKRELKRATLRDFQSASASWVALCGTVFDVTGDPFFDARSRGIYASWMHRDVTALLVYGGVIEGRPTGETEQTLLQTELELKDVDRSSDELTTRRRQIAAEWYARFHSRYEAVGQLTDLYVGDDWETLRVELTPPELEDDASGKPRRRGKCPLGFGTSTVEAEEVELQDGEDADSLPEIRFQGKRYDVRGSALFESPHGPLAAFVGHDITYALATQSNNVEDLDVDPKREYTYEEQLRLEQFRRIFAKELRTIAAPSDNGLEGTVTVETVDLHRLVDEDADLEEFQRALSAGNVVDAVDAVCVRTTMTPLHKAVEKNRKDLVVLLIEAGADVDAPAALYDDETPLQMAQRFGYTEIIELLAKTNV